MFKDSSNILRSLTPVGRQVMLELSPRESSTTLDVVAKEVLSNPSYTNDTKGRILESHIITSLEINKLWQACAVRYQKTKKGKKSNKIDELKMNVQLSDVCRFAGMGVPSVSSGADLTKSTLFVPNNPNYPDVDLLVWDIVSSTLFAIQVTVREKVKDHMDECKWDIERSDKDGNALPSLSDAWKTYAKASNVELVWVSDNADFGDNFEGTHTHNTHTHTQMETNVTNVSHAEWLVLLPDLNHLFPVLCDYKRSA